ncbi:MAG: heavy-metal-associated domain-containing protein [Christensenellaceae bacterium]|nr:heavy-metal-associated domain-containing protein [Christensenellaceae bacterium]
MERVTIKVGGMMCEHCKSTVKLAILGVPGVKRASVSLLFKRAKVDFDSEATNLDALREAIAATGYEALP